MEPREQRLIIILADISGYTKFMVENNHSAIHGQQLISFLIESLLREVNLPLSLQEIEGDALFLYATRPDDEDAWHEVVTQVQTKLLRFFHVFFDSIVAGRELTVCKCAICKNLDELKLKIIVHSGNAVFHAIGGRAQISGADVILAHRLLKNSVPENEYLLLTDAAYRDFGHTMGIAFQPGQESYEGFGTIATRVHFLTGETEQARNALFTRNEASTKAAVQTTLRWATKGTFRAAVHQIRHPGSNASLASRLLFVASWPLHFVMIRLLGPKLLSQKFEARRALWRRETLQNSLNA